MPDTRTPQTRKPQTRTPQTSPAADAPLTRYKQKRNFGITPEPAAEVPKARRRRAKALSFVVQKHWARRLHYDFRLELNGVMLSWAVPRAGRGEHHLRELATVEEIRSFQVVVALAVVGEDAGAVDFDADVG